MSPCRHESLCVCLLPWLTGCAEDIGSLGGACVATHGGVPRWLCVAASQLVAGQPTKRGRDGIQGERKNGMGGSEGGGGTGGRRAAKWLNGVQPGGLGGG